MQNDRDIVASSVEASSRLHEGMARLARELQTYSGSVDGTLAGITAAAVRLIAGADYAAITLVEGKRLVETRAATGDVPRYLDRLQQDLGEGPCLDSAYEHQTVRISDMATEQRWPGFAAAATKAGIGSMLSFQLYTEADNLGALNVHSQIAYAFDSDAEEFGTALAAHAAVALIGAQHDSQMRSALASRDVIGQAKGLIIERFGVNAVQAFEMVSTLSQESNTPVAALAREFVDQRVEQGRR